MNDIKPGWCWIKGKHSFRPFTEFRQIIKGKNKGKIEVILPATPSRKVLVDPASIRSYPTQTVNPKGEQEQSLFETPEDQQTTEEEIECRR